MPGHRRLRDPDRDRQPESTSVGPALPGPSQDNSASAFSLKTLSKGAGQGVRDAACATQHRAAVATLTGLDAQCSGEAVESS